MVKMKNFLGFTALIGVLAVASWAAVNSESEDCSSENVKGLLEINQKLLQERGFTWDYNNLLTYEINKHISNTEYKHNLVPANSRLCAIQLNPDGVLGVYPYAAWENNGKVLTKFVE